MKLRVLFALLFLTFTAAVTTIPCDADAARMGGGRSFGSQPAMRAPATRPQNPGYAPGAMTAPQQRQSIPQAAPQGRPGFFGGFGGGMLGGFLTGSLLGSLFGSHSAGMGAGAPGMMGSGGGIGLLDILLIGAAVWLLFRFLKRRHEAQGSESQDNAAYGTSYGGSQRTPFDNGGMQRSDAQPSGWDALREQSGGTAGAFTSDNPDIPAGFDVDGFLKGAKMAYTRMQSSWDRRDIDDIAQFATAPVIEELRRQKEEDPNPSQTQILLINAQLTKFEEFGDQDRATVYFDVLMRENPNQEQPEHACEYWTFVREHDTGSWKLDGLQQAV